MTLQKKPTVLPIEPIAPGLQPVYLPAGAWTDFSRSLNEALADLEDRFASPRPINPERIGDFESV